MTTKPAIVFVHGFAVDGRMWQPQIDEFADEYRVLAPNLPGFGPHAVDSNQTMAHALAALLDAATIDDAHLVGMSFGGAVAIDFALTFPTRVRTLTLVDALLRGRPSGIVAGDACIAHAKAQRLDDARAAWLADPLFASVARDPVLRATLAAQVGDYDGRHWSGLASTRFEVKDPAARLGELAVPTLVIVGRDDLPTFAAMADEYAASIPHAQKLVLPNVGHLSNIEAPAAFNAALRAFLQASPT